MTHKKKQCHRKPGVWTISISIAALILIAFPIIALTYISDSYALVEAAARVDTNSAVKAKKVAKQLYGDLMDGTSTQRAELALSENEINGIIALVTRGINGLKGRVNVTPIGIRSAFTFYVPENPFGDYINLTATIDPSPTGLAVNTVSIGSLEMSGGLALSLAEALLNTLLSGDNIGTRLIKAIESVQVSHSTLYLAYRPVTGLRQAIDNTRGHIKEIRDELTLLGDPELVRLYYQTLCTLHQQIGGLGKVSMGYYLSSAFSLAEKRSLAGAKPDEENVAALLALSIFLGSSSFDSVIGAIDKETFQSCKVAGSRIVLADRQDLRLHFIFSAALKVISDSGMSFAIGEFKELLDSQQGGSGFSFADLAADRAGIRFAELATDDERGALRLQHMASALTAEEVFFPAIAALPEGIPQQTFEARGGIESDYYREYLSTINARLESLPLYQ